MGKLEAERQDNGGHFPLTLHSQRRWCPTSTWQDLPPSARSELTRRVSVVSHDNVSTVGKGARRQTFSDFEPPSHQFTARERGLGSRHRGRNVHALLDGSTGLVGSHTEAKGVQP